MRCPEKSRVLQSTSVLQLKHFFHVSKMQTNTASMKNEHAIDYIQNSSSGS